MSPTLPEWLVGLTRLPYPLGDFGWAAILVGPVGFSLLPLAVSGSAHRRGSSDALSKMRCQ